MSGIAFERPLALFLLLLLPLIWWIAWRRRAAAGIARTWITLSLRSLLVALLSLSLAQPRIVRKGEALTLMAVVDASQSVPQRLKDASARFLEEVGRSKERPEDRIGVVAFARSADTVAMPHADAVAAVSPSVGEGDGSDLASGIRRAMAVLPPDTASRLILISDGNETAGNALEAADLARANGIPIDVVPLPYVHDREVVFEGIRAPARARAGQSVDLRLLLRSQGAASGTLLLYRNDRPVDLDPEGAGAGMHIDLVPGPNSVTVPVTMETQGAQRFRAVFEPAEGDGLVENNLGAATTFVWGEGRVLVVDETGEESEALVAALTRGGIQVDVQHPDALAAGPAFLADFDAVVLANMPRWAIDGPTDRLLHSYVHDLGGGLLVVGGDQSFGAGGWIDSETAKALPVKLDPPQTRELPRGALAVVVHACEMPEGNYWGQQVVISAIEALSRLDYIGIITYDWGGQDASNGAAWALPMQLAGDKSGAISAAKSMRVGDMPDFQPTLELAKKGLEAVRAGQRHIIMISDGDPAPPTAAVLDDLLARKITVTTVMIAGGLGHGTAADTNNMRAIAERTGGNFYSVTNPKFLPKIFTKEATLVSRSLIIEGDFAPQVVSTLPGPLDTGVKFPPVGGYVLTVAREGLAQVPLVITTSEGNDPLYAFWNYGLGKSIAFTSDLTGRWGTAWTQWAGFAPCWERGVRWLMRPAPPRNVALAVRLEGDTGQVDMEVLGEDQAFADFLRAESVLVAPDGSTLPMRMEQVGPGRYRGSFDAREPGAYLVSVSPVAKDGSRLGSAQAALSVAYPREFRATRDNEVLLRQIAERTGGRVLRLEDAGKFDAFDRSGLAMPQEGKRIWDLLAIIAAALLVVDVAARRLAFDRDSARDLAGRAVGAAAEATGESVAAWRRARSTRDAAAPEPQSAPAATARSASPGTPRAAVSPRPEAPRADTPPPPDAAGEDDSPMGRLRAAKERARRESEEQARGDDGDRNDGGGA